MAEHRGAERPRVEITPRGRAVAVAVALVGAVLVLTLDASSGGDGAPSRGPAPSVPASPGGDPDDQPVTPFAAPNGSETPMTEGDGIPPATTAPLVVNGRTQPPLVDVPPAASGRPVVVPGSTAPVAGPTLWTYRVEVEDGLAFDGAQFAATVHATLGDPRGWAIDGHVFQRLDTDAVDFRVILASPALTDELCAPLETNGRVSCRNGDMVVLNALRWAQGVEDYGGDLASYREYLVNHEVGHRLGRSHVECPGAGQPAPVMMQQTYGVGECTPNAWPLPGE